MINVFVYISVPDSPFCFIWEFCLAVWLPLSITIIHKVYVFLFAVFLAVH